MTVNTSLPGEKVDSRIPELRRQRVLDRQLKDWRLHYHNPFTPESLHWPSTSTSGVLTVITGILLTDVLIKKDGTLLCSSSVIRRWTFPREWVRVGTTVGLQSETEDLGTEDLKITRIRCVRYQETISSGLPDSVVPCCLWHSVSLPTSLRELKLVNRTDKTVFVQVQVIHMVLQPHWIS